MKTQFTDWWYSGKTERVRKEMREQRRHQSVQPTGASPEISEQETPKPKKRKRKRKKPFLSRLRGAR